MSGNSGAGLPVSVRALWGLREPAHKGPKRGLSLEQIVAAAVKVAAADGLAAVSMSRVAADLGASTMALYRYVGSKDELLVLMFDVGLGPPPDTVNGDNGWRAGLSAWAWGVREAYQQNPWGLRIPISGPPITPNQIAWLDRGLLSMGGTGLSEEEKLSVILLLSSFVRSEATLAADMAEGMRVADSTAAQLMAGYGRMLSTLIDPLRMPSLSAAIQSGSLDNEDNPDTEFIFGLNCILDGVDMLVRSRI